MGICGSKPITGSGNAYYSDSDSDSSVRSAPNLPPLPHRLDSKLTRAQNLQNLGRSSHPQLNSYLAAATRLLGDNVQPGAEMTRYDIENLPALVNAENARHKKLKLSQYSSPGDFLCDLANKGKGTSRAIVRLADADGDPVIHHVTVDVRKNAGKDLTLIVLEPSHLNQFTFTPQLQFWTEMRHHGVDTSRVAIVETGAQLSPNDCVMYCLNFALKAMKNSAAFDEIHRNMAETGQPHAGISFEEHIERSQGYLGQFGPDQAKDYLRDMGFAVGQLVLPPDFYNHASSAKLAREVDAIAAQNGTSHSQPESLEERVEAYTVTRAKVNGGTYSYSASIEGFRLQEIARAMARSR